ncbi:MAG: DUF2207 domain-containing protein [Pseudomonadota bacterium]
MAVIVRSSKLMAELARYALIVALLLLGAGLSSAHAREEIIEFNTVVEVEADGAFLVTERITVRAEGVEIRRGIFRDFPTVQREPSGLIYRTSFELIEVLRDDQAEPYHTEPITGGTRVYIGRADVFLRSGVYTYTLRYRSRHQMRFFDEFDEVYWNATGNFWSFPIQRAIATIRLPEGATIKETAAFTGRFGSTASKAASRIVGPGAVRFETVGPLGPREGLTVAASFQSGIIEPPSEGDVQLKLLRDNAGIAAVLVGALAVFAYMVASWWRVGRDPPRGVVFPRFEPPRGMSPAELSWVWFRGHKGGSTGKSFMAALVSLGAKGKLRIDEEGGTVTVRRTGDMGRSGHKDLPPGERALMKGLFGQREAMSFLPINAPILTRTTSTFRKTIYDGFKGRYFKRNPGYTIIGVVIAVLALFAFLALFASTDAIATGVVVHFVGGLIVGITVGGAWAHFAGRSTRVGGLLAVTFVIIAAGVVAGLAAAFHISPPRAFATGWIIQLTMLVAAAMGFTITLFARLMFAPTVEGQALMDEIEGFRLYLSVAESERMNMEGAPDFSLDLYERFLPYAIGLGVEKPWSEALEAHLEAIPAAQRTTYQPSYYHGRSFDSGSIAASTAAIASTIGAAYASSMPRSSGSSGGGGGSSGGGGGGGGGGGW